MKKYEIRIETFDDGYDDLLTYWDDYEAENEFDDIIQDPSIISATLTEFYIYGGMCQGEKLLREYKKEEI